MTLTEFELVQGVAGRWKLLRRPAQELDQWLLRHVRPLRRFARGVVIELVVSGAADNPN